MKMILHAIEIFCCGSVKVSHLFHLLFFMSKFKKILVKVLLPMVEGFSTLHKILFSVNVILIIVSLSFVFLVYLSPYSYIWLG